MKLRNSFVSNSSSASFVIQKSKLSEKQIDLIKNHIEACNNGTVDCPCDFSSDPYWHPGDGWKITEDEDAIKGFTIMDNFRMEPFFKEIGIEAKDFKIDDD